ncbi:MAG: SPOR domain-containing protein [Pseudoxanthomonas sp.]
MDSPLKQRLIGAVVLIALAVIFLPMLVKGPAPDSGVSDVSMKVPDEPKGDFVEIPLGTPGAAPAGGALGMPAAVKPEATSPAASSAVSQPASDTALPSTAAAGDYAVSFGAYASAADADAVVARLKQAQLPGFVATDTLNGRAVWRVRVGPYADRAQAEVVRLQAIKVRNDVNAQVIALDAGAPAAPEPAASTPQPTVATQPTRTEALPPEPTASAPPKPETPKPEPAKPEPAKPVAAAPKPVETPKPVATPAAPKPEPPKPEPAKPAAPAAASTGFAVQLGAFSNAAEANALRDRVRAAGFSAIVDQVNTDKGTLSRVRVGPVATRAQAEQLQAQVAAKLGQSGQVRPHP